jgi:hypothetical protein
MPQEIMAEPHALACSFDEPWNVGQNKAPIPLGPYHAEIGELGGKGIVGDFRSSSRKAAKQCTLASVWHSDESYVGDGFELHYDAATLSLSAIGRFTGSLIGRVLEVGIAPSPFATASRNHFFSVLDQILDDQSRFTIHQDGTRWNIENEVLSISTMLVCTTARGTWFGSPVFLVSELDERVHSIASANDDTSSMTTVTTVGPTFGHMFLAPKAHASIAAMSSNQLDFDSIHKHAELTMLTERKTE